MQRKFEMASNTKNVKLGPCVVYYETGEDSGQFVDLGYTKGGVEVQVETDTHEVTVDQFGETAINEIITARNVTVTIPLAETTMDNLLNVMPGAEWDSEADKNCVVVNSGVGSSLLGFARALILRPKDRVLLPASATKAERGAEDFVVFKAGTAGGIDFSYNSDEERIFNVELKGYPDIEEVVNTGDGDVPLCSFGYNADYSDKVGPGAEDGD